MVKLILSKTGVKVSPQTVQNIRYRAGQKCCGNVKPPSACGPAHDLQEEGDPREAVLQDRDLMLSKTIYPD